MSSNASFLLVLYVYEEYHEHAGYDADAIVHRQYYKILYLILPLILM